jgi:flagellin
MNSDSLGLTALDISKQGGATAAIDIISKAVATVSSTRADLGALQNELEHTANNLSTMNENLTSAESTIRDVDMTDEYVQYSKNQILSQAANSMLAQANAQPQNVLTLLKG